MLQFFKILLATCLIFGLVPQILAKQIAKERSIYRNVVIIEENGIRCMRFESRRLRITNQACIDVSDSNRLVFEYAHGILAGLSVVPKPKRVLILGLGGGLISRTIHQLSPETEVVSVDIDPVVVKMAKQYFDYQENAKVQSVISDGRVYVKRAKINNEKFDWIILDAFNGDYIPEHMMTEEFLEEVKAILNPGGLLAANTFSNSLLYDYESATYQKVFGKLQIYKAPTKGNRVIFACACDSFDQFPKPTKELATALKPFKVNPFQVHKKISDKVDWDENSETLTDQYSPANLLKQND